MTKPMVTPETIKARNAFYKSAEKKNLTRLAVAAYRHALDTGLAHRLVRGGWAPNAPSYQAWKERRMSGQSTPRRGGRRRSKRGERIVGSTPWIRTGRTLRAVSHNVPVDLGTKKGVRLSLNPHDQIARIELRAFKSLSGSSKGLQERVGWTLQRGSHKSRLQRWADKVASTPGYVGKKGKKWTTEEAQAEVDDLGKSKRNIPPRPLFVWMKAWQRYMEDDLAGAIVDVLRSNGIDAKKV